MAYAKSRKLGERTCRTGKVRYGSSIDAKKEVARQAAQGEKFDIYPCFVCTGWHLTSK